MVELICKWPLDFTESEGAARLNARRSIVALSEIPAGTIIEREMLTFKRPGTGISPSRLDEVIGRRATALIPEDAVIAEEMVGL